MERKYKKIGLRANVFFAKPKFSQFYSAIIKKSVEKRGGNKENGNLASGFWKASTHVRE